jgi:hypothetical protein
MLQKFAQLERLDQREMENISKDPTFGDFVTILTEGR